MESLKSSPSSSNFAPTPPSSGGSAPIWLLFAATSALYFLADNEADNDLWVHLLLGRRMLGGSGIPRADDLSFTATGAAWVDHEWLLQILFAAIFEWTGASGLWLAKIAIGGATAWLLWRSIRRQQCPLPVQAATMVLVLATLARGFSTRPQIATYLFAAALLLWLDARTHRPPRLRAEVPLIAAWMCLWSNLHGGFIVGLGILVLWSLSPPWHHLPARLALPAAGLFGACLTPYGPALFTYILGELSAPHPLTEWQPVQFGDPAQRPFWATFFLCAATIPFARLLRQAPWRAVLLAGTAFLAMRHQRHVPLFAICAAAPLADQLGSALSRLPARFDLSPPARRIITAAVAALALMQVGLLAARLWQNGATIVFDARDYPVAAVRYMREQGLTGKLALPLDWGGYALWHLSPRVTVSLDGRFATVYPPPVVAENFDFFAGVNDDLVRRRQPDYVLTVGNAVMRALPEHGYHLVHRDEVAALYARNPNLPRPAVESPSGTLRFP